MALLAAALILPRPAVAQDLFTLEERQALDLDRYVVVDPSAGYFDVAVRQAWLQATGEPILRQAMDRLRIEVGCRDKLALPVIDHELRLPSFYEDQEAWREAIRPLFAFEDAVTIWPERSLRPATAISPTACSICSASGRPPTL